MERGSSDGAVQPEPGGLRPALLTVSGLQVSRLRLLSLALPQLQLQPLLSSSPPLKMFSSYDVNIVAGYSAIQPMTTSQGEVKLLGSDALLSLEPVLRLGRSSKSEAL